MTTWNDYQRFCTGSKNDFIAVRQSWEDLSSHRTSLQCQASSHAANTITKKATYCSVKALLPWLTEHDTKLLSIKVTTAAHAVQISQTFFCSLIIAKLKSPQVFSSPCLHINFGNCGHCDFPLAYFYILCLLCIPPNTYCLNLVWMLCLLLYSRQHKHILYIGIKLQ